jgi:hypothetical protein
MYPLAPSFTTAFPFFSLSRDRRRFLRGRREGLQFGHRLVQLLFFILGRALSTRRPRHQAALRIDRDFKMRANEHTGQVSVLDPQPDSVHSIPGRKLRLIQCAKARRAWRAQLLGNRGFRGLEILSFVGAAGQGDGQHKDGEQQDPLHMSGFHRFRISIGTILWCARQQIANIVRHVTTLKQPGRCCRGFGSTKEYRFENDSQQTGGLAVTISAKERKT